MIDVEGYRSGVVFVLMNERRELLWGKRIGQSSWQFPQGGLLEGESHEQALFRELQEELGLPKETVRLVAKTRYPFRYRIPPRYRRGPVVGSPLCIGQKQIWFLLEIQSQVLETQINLAHSEKPEFDGWQWISFWSPIEHIVYFKREVYRRALSELHQTWLERRGRSSGHAYKLDRFFD